MYKIYITQDVAKEAKELLEKDYEVVIGKNLTEDELCDIQRRNHSVEVALLGSSDTGS